MVTRTRKRKLPILEDSDSDESFSDTDYASEPESPKRGAKNAKTGGLRAKTRAGKTASAPPGNRGGANGANGASETQENPLFLALSSREVAVADLALDWVDTYINDSTNNTCNAITDMFNLILKSCGCSTLAQSHDMLNDDSAAATVAEVALMFERQRVHEYPFISNNKEIRFFRHNVLDFFEHVLRAGHENGALYKDESDDSSLAAPMVSSLLAWLVALSACTVRPLRYVATLVLLRMQNVFCELVSAAAISLEKQKRSLAGVRGRSGARVQERVLTINNTIATFSLQKDTLMEYISDVLQSMFVHRYRDVDVAIRAECTKHLADWMTLYTDFFLQPEYLRYFGWLLSDPADSVKEEVVKSLHKLYRTMTSRKDTMGSGFRQFSDRFKKQLINMVWVETHSNIKVQLFGVYQELFKLGFLDAAECHEVCSYAFYMVEAGFVSGPSPKVQHEVCKFIEAISLSWSSQELERFAQFLSDHHSVFDDPDNVSVSRCLHIKILVELLDSSYTQYVDVKRPSVMDKPSEVPLSLMVSRLFSTIYTFSEHQGTWESIVRYLLYDMSSVEFTPKNPEDEAVEIGDELKNRLDLSSSSLKYVALSVVSGAILRILTSKKGTSDDDFNHAMPRLVTYFSSLEEFSTCSSSVFAVFMTLWNSVLIAIPAHITQLYANVASVNDYNFVHEKILRYYADVDLSTRELNDAFDDYFQTILSENGSDKIVTTQVSMKIEDLMSTLVTEAIDDLMMSEPIEDTNDSDENNMLATEQKVVINRILNVKTPLQKLNQLALYISINHFVSEPILGSSKILLEVLVVKVLSKCNFRSWVQEWPTSLSVVIEHVADAFEAVYKFFSVTLSRKLEDLTFASNDGSSIDLLLFLGDYTEVCRYGSEFCIQLCESVNELNEITSDSNPRMRLLLKQLVGMKHSVSMVFLDIVTSMRVFHANYAAGNQFKNFEPLFDTVRDFVDGEIPEKLKKALMDIYLIEEARVAHEKKYTVERLSGENVNYEDYVFEEGSDSEKELCVFTVKMYSLQRTGGLGADARRMELNARGLGKLYQEIVRQNQDQGIPVSGRDSDPNQESS